ncbi:MAG: hypothetical protein ACHP79_17565 [Terriglobales bacterium]
MNCPKSETQLLLHGAILRSRTGAARMEINALILTFGILGDSQLNASAATAADV